MISRGGSLRYSSSSSTSTLFAGNPVPAGEPREPADPDRLAWRAHARGWPVADTPPARGARAANFGTDLAEHRRRHDERLSAVGAAARGSGIVPLAHDLG